MAAQKNASNINFQQTVENKKDTKKRSNSLELDLAFLYRRVTLNNKNQFLCNC